MQLPANVGVRIGADIAAALPCIVTGREALRCSQCARSGSEHESQCEGGLGEHGDVSCLCSSLTPSWCAFASCWCGGGRVNQPDVCRCERKQAAEQDESACLSWVFSFGSTASRRCFSPGNEVLVSLIQRGIGEGAPGAAIIQPASPVRLVRPVGSRGGRGCFGATCRSSHRFWPDGSAPSASREQDPRQSRLASAPSRAALQHG